MSTIAPKLSEFATKTYSLPCDRIGKQISKAITIRNKTDVHSKHPHTISVPFITVPKKAVEVVWSFQFPFHRGGETNTLKYSIAFRNKTATILRELAKPIYIESI